MQNPSFSQLLFYADPTWIDVALFVVGSITAAAAGVPFLLIGILFGQLIDDMNGATCSEDIGDADAYLAAANKKVLKLVYISIGSFTLIYYQERPENVGIFIAAISLFITAYVIGFIKHAPLVQKWTGSLSDGTAKASSIASEALSHIAVDQAFGAGPRLESNFSSHVMVAQKEGIKKAVAAASQARLLYFIAYSANALAYCQGSKAIAASVFGTGNGTSVGDIYTVVFLIVDACIKLGVIAPLLPLFGSEATAFLKLRADIDLQSSIDSVTDEGEKLPTTITGEVELRERISHVALTAIVGLSGSGKSTIAGLATRVYNPTAGAVLIEGHDVRTLNVRNVRSYIILVQHEPSFLDRSVLENIALGLANSPREEQQGLKGALHGPKLGQLAENLMSGADLNPAAQTSSGKELTQTWSHATGAYVNLVRLTKHVTVEEDEAPSRTSTAIESSTASTNIDKHGVDPTDLANAIETGAGEKEPEKRKREHEWHQSENRNPSTLLSVITKDAAAIGRGGVSVAFKGVSFSYTARPEVHILDKLSFTIQPGYASTIEVDGADISSFSTTSFRNDVAVVPQDSALFDGSVRFNVGLSARPGQEATNAEITSTSALDAESERALQDGLERAVRGITVITIAHRIHTVRKVDVIFVVEAGGVAAKGRHEELMEKSESYRLNAMQQMFGH
ncbi:Leptomycin B resistance protein pmd1 [Colletotrichum tanaceti]|uniref:Leptomycin B resistance protein pmd1 n=1 Tax=Colletotrichum tanaceti TaxID=1306861 RepID=A0A4U6XPH2_9PEZI|nr:Leptomycin B resistance protein pmd1 [Colletotrichum tanaceti]